MTHGSTITLDPSEWARTPESMQSLIRDLVAQLNQSHATLQSAGQVLVAREQNHLQAIDRIASIVGTISAQRSRVPRQAVFISDQPSTRIAKLAYGLKENGWQVVLLYKKTPNFNIENYFIESHVYNSPQEAVILASSFSPQVYHCFSSWEFSTSAAVIRARPGKIVFDDYDVFAGCLKPEVAQMHAEKFEVERFCIENADAICCRGVHINVSRRKLGYKFGGPALFFPEFCWNRPEKMLKPAAQKPTDALHAVYVGCMNPDSWDTPDGLLCVCDADFVRKITAKGIHYHIYPSESVWDDATRSRYAKYYEEAARNPLFHFHEPLLHEQMIEEISKYHFGLVSMSKQVTEVGCNSCFPATSRLGTHNKGFDYLDANLMVVSYSFKVAERLLRGACIVADRDSVPDVLAQYSAKDFNSEFGSRIEAVRHRLSVWRQAQKLIQFYSSL